MANKYLDLAKEVLADAATPLTHQQIWKIAKESGLVEKLGPSGKTPWASLAAQLYVEVRDNSRSEFIGVGKRPVRFFLKSREAEVRDVAATVETIERQEVVVERKRKRAGYSEKELHPLLAYFVSTNPAFGQGRQTLTKTISESRSIRKGYSEWSHPDMVGVYLPLDDWGQEVVNLNRLSDNNLIRLRSFELKKSLSQSTYREAFFQAVSNSSWANEGYLVAAEIDEDDDLLAELQRLSASFGIGVIHLRLDEIDASVVAYPARSKPSLDWETINKLSENNPDFRGFIQRVKIDYDAGRFHKTEYDSIPKDASAYAEALLAR